MPVPDYFPLTKGLVLEYRTKNAQGSGTMSIEVLSVAKSKAALKALCHRTTSWGGQEKHEEYAVLKDATGVYSGSEPEYPLPVKLGRKWNRYPNEYEIAAIDAVATVPAGTYLGCLKVSYLVAGGDAGFGERFYAPGVGFISEICTDESDPYEFALRSIIRQ